jgi:hypothetical protein
MKICVIGIPGINLGKCNIKDPRLDEADRLVEAKKKTYVQVDVVGEEEVQDADAVLVHADRQPDLILQDLEFVETRLGREPQPGELSALQKFKVRLESEQVLYGADLTPEESEATAAYRFATNKPITIAKPADLEDLDALMVRAYQQSDYISFLTVGGKENRAWPVRKGLTAWEAAGAIHTDIQKGFIRAEIISFEDFSSNGGETQAKRAGKQRLETKQYIMQDYDVVNFRFSK